MMNTIKVFVYTILVAFFASVIYNAFLFSKGIALYKYLFTSIDSNFQLVAYYLIKSLPAIIMNFFIIWILNSILDITKPWVVMIFYIISFLLAETAFFYVINPLFFHDNNNIYHYGLSMLAYSISLWALTFSSINNSSYSPEKEAEATDSQEPQNVAGE